VVHDLPKIRQKNGLKRSSTGLYSFRKQVPEKLRQLWGKREVKVKLETKDEATALHRAAMLLDEFKARETKLTKLIEAPESLSFQEVIQIADTRVRQWEIHPDQAPILKAGASEEEYKAFREAEQDYLERRETFWLANSDALIDEEQRQRDYDSGRWGSAGYIEPYRKPDTKNVNDMVLQVADGKAETKSQPNLRDALVGYLEDYRERNVDGNFRTIQSITNNTTRLIKQFATFIEGGRESEGMKRLVTSVTSDEALHFRAWLRKEHPNSSTAEGYLRYPSAVFQHAIDKGQGLYIDSRLMRNPFYKLRNKKREKKFSNKVWSFTPDEFARYEVAANEAEQQIRLLVLFQLYTGCRISDVAGLQVRDINLTENIPTMYLRDNIIRRLDKGGLQANIPLVGPLLEELRIYTPPTNATDPFLLRFGGLKSYRDRAQQEVSKVLKRAGVMRDGVKPHSARHTWQDRLDAARVPIAERDYLLAHKTDQSSAVAAGYGTFYPPKNMLENQLAALNCKEWGDFRI
jgi:integrase